MLYFFLAKHTNRNDRNTEFTIERSNTRKKKYTNNLSVAGLMCCECGCVCCIVRSYRFACSLFTQILRLAIWSDVASELYYSLCRTETEFIQTAPVRYGCKCAFGCVCVLFLCINGSGDEWPTVFSFIVQNIGKTENK